MSYQSERDEFIAIMTGEGLDYGVARRLLSAATTLHRLAEAQCNGDWPADNGERQTAVCSQCSCAWAPSVLKGKEKLCPDCRTTARVVGMLPTGFKAIVNGDPRGCVVKLMVPSGRTNDWGHEGICVPVRSR